MFWSPLGGRTLERERGSTVESNAAAYHPYVAFAVTSLALAVVVITLGWAALFRKPLVGLPVGLALVIGLLYTLYPDGRSFTLHLDSLLLLVVNVGLIYAVASLIGNLLGDALHRREQARQVIESLEGPVVAPSRPAPSKDEEDEDGRSAPRAPWLDVFRACWYRPGPVA